MDMSFGNKIFAAGRKSQLSKQANAQHFEILKIPNYLCGALEAGCRVVCVPLDAEQSA